MFYANLTELSLIAICFYLAGFVCALFALWKSRTPQGATAWVIGLLGFPFLAVPLFLIFGTKRFNGYIRDRKELDREAQEELSEIKKLYQTEIESTEPLRALNRLAHLCQQPGFTAGNEATLLVDGENTFHSMFENLKQAKEYILFQFYIFRDDEVGRKFIEILKERAKAGVRVYFLYDVIGTNLKRKVVRELESAGIEVGYFQSTKFFKTSFQLNFRNHRKVIVVDGKTAFVGGLNVGDDYLGKWKSIGAWRDTHIKLEGPSALSTQLSFVKDWHWAKEVTLGLSWTPHMSPSKTESFVLHSGPADDLESCLLTHITLINSAKKRVWISNAYFVPPEGLMNAMEAAVLRGVDVRLIAPHRSDNPLINWGTKVFMKKTLRAGVKIFEYMPGFLHQKVMLIDDDISLVGSANFDFRSMFINFEILSVSVDPTLAKDLEEMLKEDFSQSREIFYDELNDEPLWKRMIARAASLFAPIL